MLIFPRYCPHCAKSGLKTKVKKIKLDPTKDDLTIMCKNAEVTFILKSLQLIFTPSLHRIVPLALFCGWLMWCDSEGGAC